MTMTTIDRSAFTVEGAVDVREKAGALRPWRLPADDLELHHPMLVFMASLPAGVRLRFRTDSPTVVVTADLVTVPELEALVPVWDLTIDGEVVASTTTPSAGGLATATFEGLPAGDKVVEVWLPANRGVRLHGVEIADGARAAAAPDGRERWVVYGACISHGLEGHGPSRSWPATASRLLDRHLTSLGFAGQCHLDPLVARTIAALPADHITLKLGINIHNGATLRERTFAPLVQGFLSTVRDGHPTTPITVVSPILSPEREDDPRTTRTLLDGTTEVLHGELTLAQIRGILAGIVDVRRRRGDDRLDYVDGRELFGSDPSDAAEHLPDGLHPDGDGLERIGQRYAAR
jgi:hypothetical protein